MRFLVALALAFTIGAAPAAAQDQAELSAQLTKLLVDYPNAFANVVSPTNSSLLGFHLTGTEGDAFVIVGGTKRYVLTNPESGPTAEATKAAFERWSASIDAVAFNGAKLVGKACPAEDAGLGTIVACRTWSLDNSAGNIDPKYLPFTIKLTMFEVGFGEKAGSYGMGITIGSV